MQPCHIHFKVAIGYRQFISVIAPTQFAGQSLGETVADLQLSGDAVTAIKPARAPTSKELNILSITN